MVVGEVKGGSAGGGGGWEAGVGLHGAYLELMSLMCAFSSFKLLLKRQIACRHPKHTLRG